MIPAAHHFSFDRSTFRRETAMRPRSIILVVIALLLLPGVATAQNATPAASPAAAALTFEGQVDVGEGRTVHLACAGNGGPPVLLEWGGPNPDGAASAVIPAIGPDLAAALGTRFCAYDRAGTSQSAPDAGGVRTLGEAAADLAAVLRSPELGCPCVVVGVSLGGAIAQVALADDASGFGGLVLLDAIYPGAFDDYLVLAPKEAAETAQWLDLARGKNPERLDMVTNFRALATPVRPPTIPIVVVTHGAGDPPPCQGGACTADFSVAALESAWQAGQADLAHTLGARFVVAVGTGHAIADENPELAIALTAQVLAAVRDPSTWATPVASPTA
jgi:pimeloyl-ACP methyl ester carboxylesterase